MMAAVGSKRSPRLPLFRIPRGMPKSKEFPVFLDWLVGGRFGMFQGGMLEILRVFLLPLRISAFCWLVDLCWMMEFQESA